MSERGRPRAVVIDCDPGTDDAIALMLALASPDLQVVAITVAGGNARLAQTLANARGVVALAGASVPVYAGADHALLRPFPAGWAGHGKNGVAGVSLPPGSPARSRSAAAALRALLRAARHPLTLVGLAPVTNLALALGSDPSLVAKVEEVVLLSGALGRGNASDAAEFNAWCDPEALALVLASGVRVTLATIETARGALATPARIARLRASGRSHALQLACDILVALPPSARFGGRGTPLYDPIAVAWLTSPALFRSRPVALSIDITSGASRGRTIVDINVPSDGTSHVRLLTDLDADGFFTLLEARLPRLP